MNSSNLCIWYEFSTFIWFNQKQSTKNSDDPFFFGTKNTGESDYDCAGSVTFIDIKLSILSVYNSGTLIPSR